MSFSNVIF